MRSSGMTSVNVAFIGCSTPSGIRMTTRKRPPVRRSTSHFGVVSGFGVNHCDTYSGLLHASKTRRFGASNTRCMRSSGLEFSTGTALLLLLHFFEESLETIEALLPESAVALH